METCHEKADVSNRALLAALTQFRVPGNNLTGTFPASFAGVPLQVGAFLQPEQKILDMHHLAADRSRHIA